MLRLFRVSILALSLFALVTGCASSKPEPRHSQAGVAAPWEHDPVFLSQEAISVNDALPAPPAPNSEADQADFRELLVRQADRLPADCARAEFEVIPSLGAFFGPKYGPLTADEVRRWSPFFEKVRIDTDYFVQAVKRRWPRARPYVENEHVHPCVKKETTGAYPSGHAAISRVFAKVLGELSPARKEAFLKRADEIALDRVISGVHHPTDIQAGKKLGDEVYEALIKDRRFKAGFVSFGGGSGAPPLADQPHK